MLLSHCLFLRRFGDARINFKKSLIVDNLMFGQQRRRLLSFSLQRRVIFSTRQKIISGKCLFHTSPPRFIPPIILLLLRPLSRLISVVVGRTFRKWWQGLSPKSRIYFINKAKENKKTISIVAGGITGVVFLFYANHIEKTPITGRHRFILFNPEQFNQISEEMYRMNLKLHEGRLLPPNHKAYQFVRNVTAKLVNGNRDIPQMVKRPWTIVVINDPGFNAFVLPSGQIFVYTGMLRICSNEDQLGVVLGHEMAHAILGHTAELVTYIHILDMILMVLATFIWALLPSDLTSIITHWMTAKLKHLLLELPYSRMLETEADYVGLFIAAKSCFDVRESSAFWSKMEALKRLKLELTFEWLSTHPSHERRATNLDQLIPKAIQVRNEENCPLLPAIDPRVAIMDFQRWAEQENKRRLEELTNPAPISEAR